MNWLRRLIPWAFEHDMHVALGACKWDSHNRKIMLRLTCSRCGFRSDDFEISDFKQFRDQLYKRGCRGAR